MVRVQTRDRPLIEPIYTQSEPNQPIDLGSTPVQFTLRGKTYDCESHVYLRFVPTDRVCFVVPTESIGNPIDIFGLAVDNSWDGKFKLTDRGLTLDMLLVSISEDEGVVFTPKISCITVSGQSDSLIAAEFHLFNFPDFHGSNDYVLKHEDNHGLTEQLCGCTFLKAGGWHITIAATDQTNYLCKALRIQGGFVITHIVKVEREDGSLFSSKELENIRHCLHYYLSFVLGRWAGVALLVGTDNSGGQIYEQWGLPRVEPGPWKGAASWFDSLHGDLLAEVFPGFYTLWQDELWQSLIRKALYWYLGANERGTGIGVDTGLILAQTALELLSWAYCVQYRKMVSPEAFQQRGLSAPDKLRLLASALGIPLELPEILPRLSAERRSYRDSMGAITNIRNQLVHPDTNNTHHLSSMQYYEAWKLSLWILDLALLHLCGHNGQYANRLIDNRWAGTVETVPWAMGLAKGIYDI